MNEALSLLSVLVAGYLIGFIFYGGLIWTIKKGFASANPALWFLCSFWLRIGFVLAVFYRMAGLDWRKLITCFAGFIIARLVVTRLARRVLRAD